MRCPPRKVIIMDGKKKTTKAEPEIIVYSTPTCPYCHHAKQFLKENKADFKEIDVSKDQGAAQEMVEKSGQMGVPVLDVKGTIIVGFDREAIRQALEK